MSNPDVIVIGAGHNGLTAAATLARGGATVVVLEASDRIGGSAATIDVAPGCRDAYAFSSLELLHPGVVADLGLARHGLRLETAPAGTTVLGDGEPLVLDGGQPAAGLATADARGLRALERLLGRTAAALETTMSGPLPEIEPSGLGDLIELLTLGWRLRKLGKRDMPEAMRMLPMSARDIVEEHVQDPRLQAALAWEATRASWLGPWSPGGGLGLLWHRPAWRPGLLSAPVTARGGSGALVDALAAAAVAAGVEIKTGSRVARIGVGRDGVEAVELVDGSEMQAAAVLSTVDPRTTLRDLLEPGWLDPDVSTAAGNIRARGTVAIVTIVAAEMPRFTDVPAEALAGRVQIGADLVTLERAFDDAKYGRFPEAPVLEVSFPTVADPELAPDRTVAHVWLQYAAHELRDGAWGAHREQLGQVAIDTVDRHAPGFATTVQHTRVTTPADIATDLGVAGGHLYHAEPALDQALYMRPMAGAYNHRSPVAGLYLGGPGCHPGGGLTGLPGAIAARRVLADRKSRLNDRTSR